MPLYEDPAKRRKNAEKDHGPCAPASGISRGGAVQAGAARRCARYAGRAGTRNRSVRAASINRLGDDEPSPLEAQMQSKQAWFSVVLALAGWMLLLLTLGPLATFHQTPVKPIMVTMAYFCFLGSFIPSMFGLGHGLAAIRLRGDHRKLAAAGFVCAGVQLRPGDRHHRDQSLAQLTGPSKEILRRARWNTLGGFAGIEARNRRAYFVDA